MRVGWITQLVLAALLAFQAGARASESPMHQPKESAVPMDQAKHDASTWKEMLIKELASENAGDYAFAGKLVKLHDWLRGILIDPKGLADWQDILAIKIQDLVDLRAKMTVGRPVTTLCGHLIDDLQSALQDKSIVRAGMAVLKASDKVLGELWDMSQDYYWLENRRTARLEKLLMGQKPPTPVRADLARDVAELYRTIEKLPLQSTAKSRQFYFRNLFERFFRLELMVWGGRKNPRWQQVREGFLDDPIGEESLTRMERSLVKSKDPFDADRVGGQDMSLPEHHEPTKGASETSLAPSEQADLMKRHAKGASSRLMDELDYRLDMRQLLDILRGAEAMPGTRLDAARAFKSAVELLEARWRLRGVNHWRRLFAETRNETFDNMDRASLALIGKILFQKIGTKDSALSLAKEWIRNGVWNRDWVSSWIEALETEVSQSQISAKPGVAGRGSVLMVQSRSSKTRDPSIPSETPSVVAKTGVPEWLTTIFDQTKTIDAAGEAPGSPEEKKSLAEHEQKLLSDIEDSLGRLDGAGQWGGRKAGARSEVLKTVNQLSIEYAKDRDWGPRLREMRIMGSSTNDLQPITEALMRCWLALKYREIPTTSVGFGSIAGKLLSGEGTKVGSSASVKTNESTHVLPLVENPEQKSSSTMAERRPPFKRSFRTYGRSVVKSGR